MWHANVNLPVSENYAQKLHVGQVRGILDLGTTLKCVI